MDKHLIANNHMSDNGHVAIIRTVQPVSIYEVLEGKQEPGGIYKQYTYVAADSVREEYTFRCHHFFSTDIDTVEENQVYKFMDDAWHFFAAYMKWEDEQDHDQ